MKFSILIPAYKSKFLSECIESCLKQSYSDYEIIIVDDCSPENLQSIVNSYKDEKIHYYRNAKNCGALNVVDNWNICLNYANGDYIICIGDDDKLCYDSLTTYADLIKKYPHINLFHAWTEIIDENSIVTKLQEKRPEWESDLSYLWHRWNVRNLQYIGDFCFKREILQKVGGFYSLPMAWGSDDYTALLVSGYKSGNGYGVANTQVPCFQYRQSGITISNTHYSNEKIDAIQKEQILYKKYLENYKLEEVSKFSPNEIEDKVFLKLLTSQLVKHFKRKIADEVAIDMSGSTLKTIYWMTRYRKKGISTKLFISCIIKSLLLRK